MYAQKNYDATLKGTWYISMLGINLNDTTTYWVPKGKSEISFGDTLTQQLTHPRFYNWNPELFYIDYRGTLNHQGALHLYKTKKERRKNINSLLLEYILDKDLLILIEEETEGVMDPRGIPIYDKLTVLTRVYDSLSWNKHILGAWNYVNSSNPFFDLKAGDTCRFTKSDFQTEENQLRFDLNTAFPTCKIRENPPKATIQSNKVVNGVIDGVYLRGQWFSYKYSIDLEKSQLTFRLLNSAIIFNIIELRDNSMILVKHE